MWDELRSKKDDDNDRRQDEATYPKGEFLKPGDAGGFWTVEGDDEGC